MNVAAPIRRPANEALRGLSAYAFRYRNSLFLTLILSTFTTSANAGSEVATWGNRSGYEFTPGAPIPENLTGVVGVAAGLYHGLALTSDGRVHGWGSVDKSQPPPGLTGVKSVAAGAWHSVALKSDGTVVAWGESSQAIVPRGLSNVVAVSAGRDHTLALKADGTVVGWGNNGYGQISMPAVLSGVVAVAGGGSFSLALQSDGRVVAWGQAGDGSPMSSPPDLYDVVAIAAGNTQALALKSDGTVVSWGPGSPQGLTNAPPNLRGVVAISAGFGMSLALQQDGLVVQWPSSVNRLAAPRTVGVTSIAAGNDYAVVGGRGLMISPQIAELSYPEKPLTEGASAIFAVKAQGGVGALAYQWRFNGQTIPGAISPVLNVPIIKLEHEGNYSVIASNILGEAISAPVKLRVNSRADDFDKPLVVPSAGGQVRCFIHTATREPNEPNHAGAAAGKSGWLSWRAPVNTRVVIDTIGSDTDTVLAIYVGDTLAGLSLIGADDDGAHFRGASRLVFEAEAGVLYRIAVDEYLPGSNGGSLGAVVNFSLDRQVISIVSREVPGAMAVVSSGVVGGQVVLELSADLISWHAFSTNYVSEAGLVRFEIPISQSRSGAFLFRAVRGF